MPLKTIEKIVEQGKLMKNEKRKNKRKQSRFSTTNGFSEKLNLTNNLWFFLPK